jgi:hypothetical protein
MKGSVCTYTISDDTGDLLAAHFDMVIMRYISFDMP